jgi:hypothetical protein
MAMLLSTDGHGIRWIQPTNGRRSFTLQELQAYVGGYIEVVPTPVVVIGGHPSYLVVNEDGKQAQLPYNHTATVLLHLAGGMPTDYVVGDVVLCTRADMDDDDDDQ